MKYKWLVTKRSVYPLPHPLYNSYHMGVPIVAQWLTNLTRNHEVAVQSLPLLSGLTIRCCRELWCRLQTRLGSRVAWLWRRLAATAPIRPLAWEPPYAVGAAQEIATTTKTKRLKK